MKRIAWTVMLLSVAVLVAGCGKSEPYKPAAPAAPATVEQPPAPQPPPATEPPAEPEAPAEPETPAEPEPTEEPADDTAADTGGGKVTSALGNALLKGITGGAQPAQPAEPAFP